MPATWYRWDGTDLLLDLHVQPGARVDRIDGSHGDRLKVRISAAPVDGRANTRLLRFLATEFGVPARAVTLEYGAGARSKCVRIHDPQRLLPGIAHASG